MAHFVPSCIRAFYHPPVSTRVIITVVIIMLVIGTVFAVIWWWLADVMFPGTAEKTGQRIIKSRKGTPPARDAKVITDFDQPPPPTT